MYIFSNSGIAETLITAPAASVKSSLGFPDGLLTTIKQTLFYFDLRIEGDHAESGYVKVKISCMTTEAPIIILHASCITLSVVFTLPCLTTG